ncbi:MAG: hypothetical protein ABII79_05605 [bacterium]
MTVIELPDQKGYWQYRSWSIDGFRDNGRNLSDVCTDYLRGRNISGRVAEDYPLQADDEELVATAAKALAAKYFRLHDRSSAVVDVFALGPLAGGNAADYPILHEDLIERQPSRYVHLVGIQKRLDDLRTDIQQDVVTHLVSELGITLSDAPLYIDYDGFCTTYAELLRDLLDIYAHPSIAAEKMLSNRGLSAQVAD